MTLVFYLPDPPGWHADALCAEVDTDVFFPEKGASTLPAKRICALCPVQQQCRDWALAEGEHHGIWGGTSERQRQKDRAEQRTAEAA